MAHAIFDDTDPRISVGDFGGMDMPDLDLGMLDFLPGDDTEATRYTLPRRMEARGEMVTYDNAVKLARDLRLDKGERADCFVSGNFIFGDFIEAFLTSHNACAAKMTISTLSLNQDNVDSLHNLLTHGYIQELNLIVSVYFWGNERRSLIPYIYRELDIEDRFQLAVADIHTKTINFETLGGRKIVIHGSANLRSSGNIEQFTIEENPTLYAFYDEHYGRLLAKYSTINKPIRGSRAWEVFTRMIDMLDQKKRHNGIRK